MREILDVRQHLQELKRRVQMTHRVLLQRKHSEEELTSLVNELDITQRLLDTERSKNRERIHAY